MARFEIFWSRLPLLVQGIDSASIRSLDDAATVPEMIAQLERLEPALTASVQPVGGGASGNERS